MVSIIELIVVFVFSIFTLLILIVILKGIKTGVLTWDYSYRGDVVYKKKNPKTFWVTIVIGFLSLLLFLYGIIATITSWFF